MIAFFHPGDLEPWEMLGACLVWVFILLGLVLTVALITSRWIRAKKEAKRVKILNINDD